MPSSSEQAPDRAATVPTVPRVSRDGASLSRTTGPSRTTGLSRTTGNRTAGRTTLAVIAAEAGVSLPTVSKVVNGRPDVAADTRARVERLLDEYQYTRVGTGRQRRTGLIDLVFSGLDSPWAVEILRGVEEWGASHADRGRRLRRAARERPSGQLDQRAGQPRHRRRDRGDLRGHRGPAAAAAQRRHPAGRGRPGRPAAARPGQRRRHQLGRRPGGHRAPAQPGPPPDRAPSAGPDGLPVQPGPDRRLPCRPRARPASPFDRALVRHGDFQHEGGFRPARNCSTWRPGRPRSSPATTSRRSASTRRRGSAGCGSRRT